MYINLTFHTDLIQFGTMVREMRNHLDAFETLTDTIGILEASIAVSSFRAMMEDWCEPELEKTKELYLETEEIYHPMIDEPVKNSIKAEKGVLLTGSNASGKSTFLKTIAINGLLAQTIHTVLADSWKGSFCQIYSSMALKDDLLSQESYYMVEIKSLKRILDRREDDVPLLCFVDEVLRGTNTVERIAASAQILKSMEKEGVLCFAATHDIELTYLLEEGYDNYHFQEEVKKDDILFNYVLYKGRATSRNAIRLLGIIGYEKEIIRAAERTAEQFLNTGEWHLCQAEERK
jgi:DNA mismatch repair ATPase MutS